MGTGGEVVSWPELRYVGGYQHPHSSIVHLREVDGKRINSHARGNIERRVEESRRDSPILRPLVCYELVPVEAMDRIRAFIAGYSREPIDVLDALLRELPPEVKP